MEVKEKKTRRTLSQVEAELKNQLREFGAGYKSKVAALASTSMQFYQETLEPGFSVSDVDPDPAMDTLACIQTLVAELQADRAGFTAVEKAIEVALQVTIIADNQLVLPIKKPPLKAEGFDE